MGGLIEFVVVFAFAIGWGVLELVCLRLDKRRAEQKAIEEAEKRAMPEGSSDDPVS